MAIVNVTSPIETVVSLADAKAHLKVDITDDDALITALIAAAVDYVESQLQRRLAARIVDWTTDNLTNRETESGVGYLRLPLAPVDPASGVVSITYTPFPSGTPVVLPTANYIVAADGQATNILRPYNLVWPWIGQGAAPVVVRFTVGGAALVSPAVLHAIKIVVSNLYDYRGSAMFSRSAPSVMNLTGGALNAVDALLYADRWS